MPAPLASTLVSLAWAFILVLVVATLAAMLFVVLAAPQECTSVDAEAIAEAVSDETVEALRSEGWYSDPADGLDRLYSPGCLTPGSGV